jgi:hypothetical protein
MLSSSFETFDTVTGVTHTFIAGTATGVVSAVRTLPAPVLAR